MCVARARGVRAREMAEAAATAVRLSLCAHFWLRPLGARRRASSRSRAWRPSATVAFRRGGGRSGDGDGKILARSSQRRSNKIAQFLGSRFVSIDKDHNQIQFLA